VGDEEILGAISTGDEVFPALVASSTYMEIISGVPSSSTRLCCYEIYKTFKKVHTSLHVGTLVSVLHELTDER
jgi:hypothetical protein